MHHGQDIEVIMCTSQLKITFTHVLIVLGENKAKIVVLPDTK